MVKKGVWVAPGEVEGKEAGVGIRGCGRMQVIIP